MEKRDKREEHKSHEHHASKDKEKVCETFEVEEKGKIHYKTLCDAVEKSHATREEIKRHKKILMWVLAFIGIVIVCFILFFVISYFKSHFEYRGVKYEIVTEKNLIFYKTAFPTMFKGVLTDYNFYIRNDPRKVEQQVPFEGTLVMKQNMAMDSQKDFNCDGDGIIAMANLVKFYSFAGTKVVKDPNAVCSADGAYMRVVLRESDKTSVEQYGPSCYYININNCEVLKATERLMTETFAQVNSKI